MHQVAPRAVRGLSASAFLLLALQICAANAQLGVTVNEAVDLSGPADADNKELEGLLHWAIENSDPEELARKAEESKELSVDELRALLEERKQRVKELSDIMASQVTETQAMQEIVALLSDPDASLADRVAALEELQGLVGPIDNANDLKAIGAISPILDHLTYACCKSQPEGDAGITPAEVRAAAAHVVATAASNNIKFQKHLIEASPDIMQLLVEVASLGDMGAASKALLALGNMIRNQNAARELFTKAGGPDLLRGMLLGPDTSLSAKRRALTVITDLLELDPEPLLHQHGAPHQQGLLLSDLSSAAVSLLESDDHDLQEKALGVLSGVLELHEFDSQEAVNQLLSDNAGRSVDQFVKYMDGVIAEEAKREDGDTEFFEWLRELGKAISQKLSKRTVAHGIKMPKGYNHSKDEL